jgi:hypothetical protein
MTSALNRLASLDVSPVIALPIVSMLALGLGLLRIGRLSLDHDEAIAFYLASGPWGEFAHAVTHRESFGALHYLLLRAWTTVGDGEAVLRSLSVVFAVLTVALTYQLGRALFGRRVALAAAVMLAVNAYMVQFAQEARTYALAAFAVTLATVLLVRTIERPSRLRWLGYAAAAVLSVYAHLFAGFVLVAHGFALITVRRPPVWWRWVGFVVCLVAAAAGPLILSNLRFGPDRYFIPATTPMVVRDVLEQLAGGGTTPGSGGLSLLALYAAIIVLAAYAAIRAISTEGHDAVWRYVLVFGWALLPLVLSIALSPIQPSFLGRYQIVVLPGLALLGGLAVTSLRLRPIAVAGLAFAVLLASRGLASWYLEPQKEDWRRVAQEVVPRVALHDALVVYEQWNWRALEYHATRDAGPGSLPKRFQLPVDPVAAWYKVTDLANGYDRIWVAIADKDVVVFPADLASLEQAMRARYRLDEWRRFFGVELRLYVRTPESYWESRPPAVGGPG